VPGRNYRIGIAWLADAASTQSYQDAFLDGLRELGFEAGRNLVVDVRNCNGEAAKLPGYVDELIGLKPDLLAGNDQVAQSIQRRTTRIPIVLTISNDPVATGLAAASRPKRFMRPNAGMAGCGTKRVWQSSTASRTAQVAWYSSW